MERLERFVAGRFYGAVHTANQAGLRRQFELAAASYKGAEKLPGNILGQLPDRIFLQNEFPAVAGDLFKGGRRDGGGCIRR